MKKLIYARASQDKKRVVLGIGEGDDVKRYSVGETLYRSLEISRGDEITEPVLDEIIGDDHRFRATKKALSLLSISDVSEKALVLKLRRAGYSRETAEAVAAEMMSLGYIDEARQLSRLILREANEKLRGRGQIIPRLIGKGYSSRAIEGALDALISSGELSFEDNARALLEKMLPEDSTEDEARAILYKHGYGAMDLYD